jgi:hypothetical protein
VPPAKLTPAHVHDCDGCQHVATYRTPTGELVDLYTCGEDWIARYSSDGADYSSLDRSTLARMAYEGRTPRDPFAVLAAVLGADLAAEGRMNAYRDMRAPGNLAEWSALEAYRIAFKGWRVTGRGVLPPG